jgi:hypothetical protein
MKTRFLLLLLLLCKLSIAQVLVDPCLHTLGCQNSVRNGVVHSKLSILTTKQKYNLLVGAGDTTTGQIDTTFSGTVNLKLLSGPGTFVGPANQSFSKYCYLDLKFFTAGSYELEVEVVGVGKDTMPLTVYADDFTAMCVSHVSGCVSGGGNKILLQGPGVIIVDVMFPFNVLVVNSTSGKIDVTYAGVVTLTKISGAGNFDGNLSLYGEQRISFNDLSFDQVGIYEVEVDVENIGKDTVTLVAEASNEMKELDPKKFKLFPNPTAGSVTIQLDDKALFISQINVLNVLGEQVKSFDVYKEVYSTDNLSVDLNSLAEGTYFINVMSNDKSFYSSIILVK